MYRMNNVNIELTNQSLHSIKLTLNKPIKVYIA